MHRKVNRIYRELQYGANSTWLFSEFASCLQACGDQAGSKVGKIGLWGQRGPSFDRVRPIAFSEAAERGGNPAWRHSSEVRVPTRESEALLGTRIELSKQLSYVYISRARARLKIN